MKPLLVVSPAGADTNGGGFAAAYTGTVTGWHDGSFGPVLSLTGASHDASELTVTKAGSGLGTASAVDMLVYVSGTDITSGHYPVTAIVDADTIQIGGIDSSGGNTDTVINVGGALLNLSSAVTLWTAGYTILVAPGTHAITDTTKVTMSGITPVYNGWLRIHGCDENLNINPAKTGWALEDHLSSEMLINGGFDNTDGWTVNGVGTEISGGTLTMTGTSAFKYFNRTTNDVGTISGGVGKFYLLSYMVVSNTLGGTSALHLSSQMPFYSVSNSIISIPSTQGSYYVVLRTDNESANTDFRLVIPDTCTSGSIVLDNISIKEIDVSDLDYPIFNAQGTFAASCAMINLAGADYVMVTGLELDGNDITNMDYGIWDNNDDSGSTNVIIDQVVAYGFTSGIRCSHANSVNWRVVDCETYDNATNGVILLGTGSLIYNLKTYNNGIYGCYQVNGIAIGTTAYTNGGGTAQVGIGNAAINCISDGSSAASAGFFGPQGTTTAYNAVFKNCIALNNAYGFQFGDSTNDNRAKGIYLSDCVTHNNSLGDEYWTTRADSAAYIRAEDYVTGTELLINGGFDDDTGWTVNGAGTEIDGGVVTMTGTSAAKYFNRTANDVGLVAGGIGKYYALKYTVVSNDLGGSSVLYCRSQTPFLGISIPSQAKTHTVIIKSANASSTVDFGLYLSNESTSGSIVLDNISVKEIDPDAFISHYLGGNNRVTEPPFVDAANDDYRLKSGHPNFSLLYDKTTGTLNAPLGPKSIGSPSWW